MSDAAAPGAPTPTDWKGEAMQRRLRSRYRSEWRFRLLGLSAVVGSAVFLAVLLVAILGNGLGGFIQTRIALPIDLPRLGIAIDPARLRGPGADLALAAANLEGATDTAATTAFGAGGDDLLSDTAWLTVRDAIKADPSLLTRRTIVAVPASDAIDWSFLTGSDSTDATSAGIWSALKGSILTMIVTLALTFPIGLLAALYLEEYASRNRFTDLIEVSINNLAAVPSITFGLLGLVLFLGTMHLPRSAPLVGGLTLALMTMPVIVIAGRNAIKAVPPSIREAALGIGASPVQVVFHHVLPLALPGILTGTIIGMARALGETAPLLMIGMRAFIATPPGGITDPSSVLPVQIFLWSDEVDRAFVEKTSAAIIVLLLFLFAMNGVAIYLRNRFETRW